MKSGLDYIYVSLDGPKDINDKIRTGEAVYAKVISGVKEIIETKKRLGSELPLIQIEMTVIKENQYAITETSRIAKDLGVDTFSARLPIFTTERLAAASYEILRKEFDIEPGILNSFVMDFSGMDTEAIGRQFREAEKIWGKRFRPLPCGKNVDINVHFNHPHKTHGGGLCVIPWIRAQIMPNGDVSLCEDFPMITAGNIAEDKFLDIWKNEKYTRFRRLIKEKGILPSCTRCCGLYEIPDPLNDRLFPRIFEA